MARILRYHEQDEQHLQNTSYIDSYSRTVLSTWYSTWYSISAVWKTEKCKWPPCVIAFTVFGGVLKAVLYDPRTYTPNLKFSSSLAQDQLRTQVQVMLLNAGPSKKVYGYAVL